MKVTKSQLKQIIKEVLKENEFEDHIDPVERALQRAPENQRWEDLDEDELRLLGKVWRGEQYNMETELFKLLDRHKLSIKMLKNVLTVIDDRQEP